MTQEKILVTGATGFIGSHLVDALVAEKRDVRCLVEAGSDVGHLRAKRVELVYGDVSDKNSLKAAVDKVGIIYHLAAVLSHKRKPKETYDLVNYRGTENLLELSIDRRVQKFIYFSSIGTMGSQKEPVMLNEQSPYNPVSFYEISKARAEHAVLEYSGIHKLPAVVLRPSKVYGPRDLGELLTLYKMVQRGFFRFVGKMRQMQRSFCYVGNLIEASLTAAEQAGSPAEAYFISDEKPYTLEEFLRAVARETNARLPRMDIPAWVGRMTVNFLSACNKLGSGCPLIDGRSIARMIAENQMCDISKAKRELRYRPKFSLREGMHYTINWYREKGLLY